MFIFLLNRTKRTNLSGNRKLSCWRTRIRFMARHICEINTDQRGSPSSEFTTSMVSLHTHCLVRGVGHLGRQRCEFPFWSKHWNKFRCGTIFQVLKTFSFYFTDFRFENSRSRAEIKKIPFHECQSFVSCIWKTKKVLRKWKNIFY